MTLQIIEKSDLAAFVQNLLNNFQVEGVKRKGQSVYGRSFFYDTIQSPEELCLDFDCTVMPPKKYFLPPKEGLFGFTTGSSPETHGLIEKKPFVVFGIHPYDLKAIGQMDQVFSEGNPDPHYQSRREAAFLIGVDPTSATPRAFWASMEASTVSSGFDLMLTDLEASTVSSGFNPMSTDLAERYIEEVGSEKGQTLLHDHAKPRAATADERYIVEVGSEKGQTLLNKYAKTRPATADEIQKRATLRSQLSNMCKRSLTFPKREVPTLLEHSMSNLLWQDNANKCLSCGTCNMVCPTCYCFDVWDDMELDLVHGQRLRRWDGCLLSDFAKVATGENFRENRSSRYRHRFYRKGEYLFNKLLHDVACVGCGRCASSCLPDIADPVNVFNELKERENS
jgi:sulfhydrogenase subunit beta (sulfur reductase)